MIYSVPSKKGSCGAASLITIISPPREELSYPSLGFWAISVSWGEQRHEVKGQCKESREALTAPYPEGKEGKWHSQEPQRSRWKLYSVLSVPVPPCAACCSALLFAVTYKGQQLCTLARQGYPAGKLPLGQWQPLASESYTCTGSGIMTVLLSSCQICIILSCPLFGHLPCCPANPVPPLSLDTSSVQPESTHCVRLHLVKLLVA